MIEHYTLDENLNAVPCSLREWGDLYRTPEGREKKAYLLMKLTVMKCLQFF